MLSRAPIKTITKQKRSATCKLIASASEILFWYVSTQEKLATRLMELRFALFRCQEATARVIKLLSTQI